MGVFLISFLKCLVKWFFDIVIFCVNDLIVYGLLGWLCINCSDLVIWVLWSVLSIKLWLLVLFMIDWRIFINIILDKWVIVVVELMFLEKICLVINCNDLLSKSSFFLFVVVIVIKFGRWCNSGCFVWGLKEKCLYIIWVCNLVDLYL